MWTPQLPRLTSTANSRVRQAVRLRESSRCRRRSQETLVDGVREITRAAAKGFIPSSVFVTAEALESPEVQDLLRRDAWHQAAFETTVDVFQRIAFGDRNEGLLAILQTPDRSLKELAPVGNGPIVVLDQIEKPGNVGAILRTADGAGASAVILSDPHTDTYNPIAVRASLGTIFSLPIAAAPAPEVLDWLSQRGLSIFAARPDAKAALWELNLSGSIALVFGNETTGLGEVWSGTNIRSIALPMCGIADSLNVSVTAAVMLYESLRQQRMDTSSQ